MPTKKIRDITPFNHCGHPEHDPPRMCVFQPGVYEHECPKCHQKQVFTVAPRPTLTTHPGWGAEGRGGLERRFSDRPMEYVVYRPRTR